jgi:hypothetical protein
MKQLKMSNIEKYLNLFADDNNEFYGIKWLEPIFVAMTSAYDGDTPFQLSTDNDYLLNMLNLEYKDNKTYSPIEIIKTRRGLEKISDHSEYYASKLCISTTSRYKRFKRLFTISFFRTDE